MQKTLKERLQEQYNTNAISAQVLPLQTYNEKGEPIEAHLIVVLDAEDKFMFMIDPSVADGYVFDGYVNYDKIYKDYILTEKQWEALPADASVIQTEIREISKEELADEQLVEECKYR